MKAGGTIMQELSGAGRDLVEKIAAKHGISADGVLAVLRALIAGGGTMAQFSHPDFGGMSQWLQGGMTMVGDMFNQGMKAKLDALCTELSRYLRDQPDLLQPVAQRRPSTGQGESVKRDHARSPRQWWPADLGNPASTGAQNDTRYAYFPDRRRLVIDRDGRISIHDTGEHRISGFSQQQGPDRSLSLSSQHGPVRLAELPEVEH
jgi:hypothetical protein